MGGEHGIHLLGMNHLLIFNNNSSGGVGGGAVVIEDQQVSCQASGNAVLTAQPQSVEGLVAELMSQTRVLQPR